MGPESGLLTLSCAGAAPTPGLSVPQAHVHRSLAQPCLGAGKGHLPLTHPAPPRARPRPAHRARVRGARPSPVAGDTQVHLSRVPLLGGVGIPFIVHLSETQMKFRDQAVVSHGRRETHGKPRPRSLRSYSLRRRGSPEMPPPRARTTLCGLLGHAGDLHEGPRPHTRTGPR